MKDQVCTLEQSIKLKELGITKPSVFNWALMADIEKVVWGNIDQDGGRYTHWLKLPAYTVAELGELLPAGICQTDKCPKDQGVKEWALYLAGDSHAVFMDNEAQARAAMLIHLLENDIITL